MRDGAWVNLSEQHRCRPPDNPRMNWHDLDPDCGVLQIPPALGRDREELELRIWWGGGEPTRAVWLWSQTGRVAGWAAVGEA